MFEGGLSEAISTVSEAFSDAMDRVGDAMDSLVSTFGSNGNEMTAPPTVQVAPLPHANTMTIVSSFFDQPLNY